MRPVVRDSMVLLMVLSTKGRTDRLLRKLQKKAWRLQSSHVRQKEHCCFTCGVTTDHRKHFAGHFIHKSIKLPYKLHYDAMNIRRQCVRCNRHLHGNLGIYAIKLIKIYGERAVDELVERGHNNEMMTVEELQKLIMDLPGEREHGKAKELRKLKYD